MTSSMIAPLPAAGSRMAHRRSRSGTWGRTAWIAQFGVSYQSSSSPQSLRRASSKSTPCSAIALALPGEPLEPGNLPVEVPARLAEVLQLRLQRSALHLEPGAPAILDDVA